MSDPGGSAERNRPGFRTPAIALGALSGLWAWVLARGLPAMPPRLATHFDLSGEPNGWMSPAQFAAFDVVMMVVLVGTMVGTGFLARVLPASTMNVPNRDHWFAPERRRASADRILRHLVWFACIVTAFMTGLNALLFRANLAPTGPRLPMRDAAVVLVPFLVATAAWAVRLYRLFPKPPRGGHPGG